MSIKYLVRRLISLLITLFIILSINFILFRLMPGDPVRLMFTDPRVSKENIELVRKQFGLDKPLLEQYFIYIFNFIIGNHGISFWLNKPVLEVVLERLPKTLILLSTALIISTVSGIILGAYAASREGSKKDVLLSSFAVVSYSLPPFWIGLLFIMIFSYRLKLFPLGGFSSIGASQLPPHIQTLDILWHLTLPVSVLIFYYLGGYILITRNSMVDVLKEDFILTAFAKGVPEKNVVWGHALRSAILPVATIFAINVGWMVAGVIEVEIVFSFPGVGSLIYQAIEHRDYPLLQGAFFIIALSVLAANFVIDLLYSLLDPRVRRG